MTENELQENQLALEKTLAALESAVAQKDQAAEAAARAQLGQIALLNGNFAEAIDNFEGARAIAEALGLAGLQLQTLYGLTQAAAGANDANQAVVYGKQTIEQAHQVNAQEEEVQAIQTVTGILAQHGTYGETIPYLLRGVEIAGHAQNADWELKFLSDLGMAYYLNDEMLNAENYTRQAYDLALNNQKKLEEAILAGRLSSIRADMGKIEIAIDLNKHAIQLAQELNDPILEAEQLVLLAMNYLDLGAADKAESPLQQAKKLYLELDEIKYLVQVEKLLQDLHSQKSS